MRLGGRYEVRNRFEGGMGVALVCVDIQNNNDICVLKTYKESTENKGLREGFVREAQAWIHLQRQEYLAKIDDIITIDGRTFLKMPYYSAGSLNDRLRKGQITLEEAATYTAQIALGMRYVSDSQKMLHLDLKPDNILIGDRGQALVSDLGLARPIVFSASFFRGGLVDRAKVDAQGIVGTVPYMAPEMLMGVTDLDARADIWAFGLIVYEMVTGKMAFDGPDVQSIAAQILTHSPQHWKEFSNRAAGQLVTFVERCIEKDRTRRYQNFSDVCDGLDACVLTGIGDTKAPFWKRDARLKLTDQATANYWTSEVGNRKSGKANHSVKYTEFMLLKQARQLRAIGKSREAVGVLEQLLGSFDDPHTRINDLWRPHTDQVVLSTLVDGQLTFQLGHPALIEAVEVYLVAAQDLCYDRDMLTAAEHDRYLRLVRHIMRAGPPSAKSAELCGQVFIGRELYDEASEAMAIALQHATGPVRVSSMTVMIVLLSKREEWSALRKFTEECVVPELGDIDDARSQEACARAYQRLGEADKALAYFERSLSLDPDNLWAILQACTCAWNCGRPEEARQWRIMLSRKAPDSHYLAGIDRLIPSLRN